MAKVLIRKAKKELVDGREHTVIKEQTYYVENTDKDFHTTYGVISQGDLAKPSGSIVTSSTGKEFMLLDAGYTDHYQNLKKLPQTIPLKDIGSIIAETGVNGKSIIVDAGLGSGALAIALANIAKKVVSYEVREDHIRAAEQNIKRVGAENITIKHLDITAGIDEKNVDLITLDLPEPWTVIPHAAKALKPGGYILSYSPSIPQVQDFVKGIRTNEHFLLLKTIELIERPWEFNGRRVRPKSTSIGHSGFLTFARKIKA